MKNIFRNRNYLILIVILFVAFFLRFFKLGTYPALNADEAALGYNAYSLIKTGLDEHGNRWPMYFQSFNDYKPALTGYLMMPTIFLFGLSEWSVRLIPAFLSFLTVFSLYLLVKQLFKNENLALVSAFLLSINPWHIHFSRGAWEVSVATFFVTLGCYFFLRFKERRMFLVLSVIFFVLSLYTYHAARIFVPLLAVSLSLLYFKELIKNKLDVLISVIVGVVLCIPLLLSLLTPSGLARAGGVALWSDLGPVNRANELRGDYDNLNGIAPKLLHNKPVAYSIAFLNNYAEHFWGEFLFLSGDDIQRNKVPETGQLYLIELLFISVGLVFISRKVSKGWAFVLFWLAVAPLPAAITFQSPHALRAQNMVIPLEIISSFGLYKILVFVSKLKNYKIRNVVFAAMFFVMFWFVMNYIHEYYVHMTKAFPFSSQYGVKELSEYIRPLENKYKNIVITDRYDQPYILFLFYGVEAHDPFWEPERFQKDHTLTARDLYGFSTVRSFANFKFESINFNDALSRFPQSLLVGTSSEIMKDANIIKDIYGTNGYRYFRIVEN